MKKATVLAIGGNAIDANSYKEEGRNLLRCFEGIENLIRAGPLVITHGNGPQVGRLLTKLNLPLWLCTAQTQGEIGILIQQNLRRYLRRKKISLPIISLLTQVLVDPSDLSLLQSTKPIGDFCSKEEARRLMKIGYRMEKDPSGKGWRRFVPSPKPIKIIEIDIIKSLLKNNLVIAGGGGGVPIYKSDDGPIPIEAVVDKDHTSGLLASKIKAHQLIMLTNEKYVKLNFRMAEEKILKRLQREEAKKYLKDGHFKTGMKTKIEAAVDFLKNGGEKVIIANVFELKSALEESSGTIITNQKEGR